MTHLTQLQLDTLWSRLILTRHVKTLWPLCAMSSWPCDLFKLPVDLINMQLGHMVIHLDNGQQLWSSYMFTVIWLVNNNLSEASVEIHSVTGIIESEPSEKFFWWKYMWKNQNFCGFPISIPKYTLWDPLLTQPGLWPCDLIITSKSQFKVCRFQICCIEVQS